MKIFIPIILASGVISLLLIFYLLFKSKNFVKLIFLNMILGAVSLIILKFISKFTGVEIWINQFTMSSSLIFGIPAVITLIIFNLIFI